MNTELIKVEEFTTLIQSAPDALSKNKNSIMACNNTGQCLLDIIEGEGMNDEIDTQAAEYLKKVGITIKNMQTRRSPITQIFDRIRSIFTADEKAIDPKDVNTIPGKIAAARDEYATKKRLEEKKRREEVIRNANIEKEKATYRADIAKALNDHFNTYLSEQSDILEQTWGSISLNNFDLVAKAIKEWPLIYPKEHFDQFTRDIPTYYIDALTKGSIKAEVFRGKYEQYAEEYKFNMEDSPQSFIDRLRSKKQELTEIRELQIRDANAAVKAEKERMEREERERIEREAETARRIEKENMKQASDIQQATMNSLFASAQATVVSSPIKAKITERIKVLHPGGVLEIYQKWWLEEGQTMTIEELEKIHKKMITFCEKKANKDNDKIVSKYIRYEEEVKAK